MHAHDIAEDVAKIKAPAPKPTPDHWYKRFARDYYEGTRELKLDERGAYSDILDMIYMAGGPIKDDERLIAYKMHVDVRTWRRIRKRLLALGKLYLVRGYLHNARAKSVLDQREVDRRSMGDRGLAKPDVQVDLFKNHNEINGNSRASSTESDRQKEEVESESNIIPLRASQSGPAQPGAQPPSGLAGLNGGAADPMIKDIVGWMGGGSDERNAREWLSKMIAINGESVVRDSYSKLLTELASASSSGRRLIAQPLRTLCGIIARMRADAGKAPQQGHPVWSPSNPDYGKNPRTVAAERAMERQQSRLKAMGGQS